MMKYIGSSWKRNRERLFLLIIGVMVISSGLSYLFHLTETTKGTVVENLQKSWVSSYDIVVKPKDSLNESLLEPNYLNGITGGISIDQFNTIKEIEGVEIAAPISIVGYAELGVIHKELYKEELSTGIYRVHINEQGNDGLENFNIKDYSYYFTKGSTLKEDVPGLIEQDVNREIPLSQMQLLVGVDPIEEAKLVGLDKAIETIGNGRYFNSLKDRAKLKEGFNSFEIPVIINTDSFSQTYHTIRLEKLNLGFDTEQQQKDSAREITNNGGLEFLDTLPNGELINTISLTSKELEYNYFHALTGISPEHGEGSLNPLLEPRETSMVIYKSSPLQFEENESPFEERWKHAFITKKVHINLEFPFNIAVPKEGYRDLPMVDSLREVKKGELPLLPFIKYNVVGFYNPNNITVSKDPLNELPLETYRPPQAKLVLDENSKPINPPSDVIGIGNPTGFLTNPPNIITTIEATEMLTNGNSISSIRIKINGVDGVGETSQKRVESIAKEIADKTGLVTVVTLGSSPQPTITEIQNGDSTLGWIEQPWINIGNAITIFRETTLGYSGVIISMLLVAVVYVFSTSLVSFLSRRKEFSILLSLGWDITHIRNVLMIEAVIQWMMVIFISSSIEFIIYLREGLFSTNNILYIATFGFLVYALSIIPLAFMVRKITPYEAMRTGEISTFGKRVMRTNGTMSLVLNNILSKWKRNLLSLLVIAMPTSLFSFYLFVTYRLQGVLYTSFLGEYVALNIDVTHYITLAIAFGLAILTTAEIMWQNITERKNEIGILQAIGWGRSAIRLSIIMEGAIIGFIAGLTGLIISIIVIGFIYGEFPTESFLIFSATMLVPIIIGIVGSILPSEIGVRTKPINAMKAS